MTQWNDVCSRPRAMPPAKLATGPNCDRDAQPLDQTRFPVIAGANPPNKELAVSFHPSSKSPLIRALLVSAMLAIPAVPALAETLFWARSSDVQTLDPHAYNEGITWAFNVNIYEALVDIDPTGKIVPLLATEWRMLPDDPTVWEFKLRQGVTFHDGTPFTADDVVFTIERLKAETSGLKTYYTDVVGATAIDDFTVQIKTEKPKPLLINDMWSTAIMSRKWAEAHNTTAPQNFKEKEDNYASTNENGTGPYKLVSREPDRRTELEAFDGYWGKDTAPLDFDRIVYTPIQSAATRISALISGDVNFVQDVPSQDVPRLESSQGISVVTGPEARTVFLGMNIGADKLTYGTAKGNPFADIKVREAIDLSIDRKAIQTAIMRGLSTPTGTIASYGLPGFVEALREPVIPDIDKAKALMAEAGYGDGFDVTLDCTNGGAINDERICQALVGMLSKIGIKVSLNVQPAGVLWPEYTKKNTDFYLMTWGGSSSDVPYLKNLVHSQGTWAAINYSNPELDAEIDALPLILDQGDYVEATRKIWQEVKDLELYVPIHQQVMTWASSSKVKPQIHINNRTNVKNFELVD